MIYAPSLVVDISCNKVANWCRRDVWVCIFSQCFLFFVLELFPLALEYISWILSYTFWVAIACLIPWNVVVIVCVSYLIGHNVMEGWWLQGGVQFGGNSVFQFGFRIDDIVLMISTCWLDVAYDAGLDDKITVYNCNVSCRGCPDWDAMHHSYVTFANIYYMTGADPTDNRIMLWCRYLWCMLASVVMFKYKYKCLNIHLGYHKKCKLPSLSTQTTPLLWRQGIRYNLISKNQYQIYPPKHPTFNRKKKQRKASRKTNQSPNLT